MQILPKTTFFKSECPFTIISVLIKRRHPNDTICAPTALSHKNQTASQESQTSNLNFTIYRPINSGQGSF